jgi:hypothetical protein
VPKRVIDFDAMWGSDKLASCADWAQAEYAWLYGLADACGCFEITNLRVIWGRVAAIRRNLTIERLEQVFAEFQDKGLLFVWEHEGKRYAHWTGSDVPGRLPPPSWRMRLERFAPPVPKEQLAQYMAQFARGRAALAGAGFRGTAGCEPGRAEDFKFEISDSRKNRRRDGREIDFDQTATRARDIAHTPADGACERGLKEPVEAAQAQDLGLDLNRNEEQEMEIVRNGAGDGTEPDREGERWNERHGRSETIQGEFWESNPRSSSNSRSNSSSRSNAPLESECAACAQATAPSNSYSQRRSPPPGRFDCAFETRGMSAKELPVERELRVGQGPVCGPHGVNPEVIERDRLRQLARAKSL